MLKSGMCCLVLFVSVVLTPVLREPPSAPRLYRHLWTCEANPGQEWSTGMVTGVPLLTSAGTDTSEFHSPLPALHADQGGWKGNIGSYQEEFEQVHVSSLPKTLSVGWGMQESSEAANNPTGHYYSNSLLREMCFIAVTTTPEAAKAYLMLCFIRAYLKQF